MSAFPCPYCWAEVPAQATVCAHCTRDLVLFKPVAQRLQAMAEELGALRATVQAQQAQLDRLQAPGPAQAAPAPAAVPGPRAAQRAAPPGSPWAFLRLWLLTLLALGLSHWVLLFLYDARPLYLRLLTMAIPLATGLLAARQARLGGLAHFLGAVLLGVCSVGLMLGITAHIDQVPWLPASVRDWRETLEYAVSIVLAFFTGFLVHRLLQRALAWRDHRLTLRALLERDENGNYRITDISRQLQDVASALAPVASAGTALYAGLKVHLGA